jgi:hypothetical protein
MLRHWPPPPPVPCTLPGPSNATVPLLMWHLRAPNFCKLPACHPSAPRITRTGSPQWVSRGCPEPVCRAASKYAFQRFSERLWVLNGRVEVSNGGFLLALYKVLARNGGEQRRFVAGPTVPGVICEIPCEKVVDFTSSRSVQHLLDPSFAQDLCTVLCCRFQYILSLHLRE